jgi:DNA protecting protein DprA
MSAHLKSQNLSKQDTEEKRVDGLVDTESTTTDRLFGEDLLAAKSRSDFEFTLLALSSISGLGRKGLIALVDAFKGNLSKVWTATSQRIHQALLLAKTPGADKILTTIQADQEILLQKAEQQLYDLHIKGVHIIPFKALPSRLRRIPDPPRWLFVEGDPGILYHKPAVAVVGTRHPTDGGRVAAGYVARLLAPYNITLVSGLAEGIDDAAHRESMAEGVKNIAFLGHGINFIFPMVTSDIRRQIVDKGGAVVTEYLPHEHYQKSFFVERNRLQAALASLVIPVEANPRGGTAHTIRWARKYNREVIGIKWKGANGILEDLQQAGSTIIDIFSLDGSRQLDEIFRVLARSARHKTYSLAALERRAVREIQYRKVTELDIRRFVKAIRLAARTKED